MRHCIHVTIANVGNLAYRLAITTRQYYIMPEKLLPASCFIPTLQHVVARTTLNDFSILAHSDHVAYAGQGKRWHREEVSRMAARGEACFQQKHQRHRFDVGYDLVFDPDAVDYCTFFSKAIIPAKHCGASCPAFKPLDRTSSTDNSDAHVRHSRPLTNSTASLTSHLMRSHRSLWQRLEIVSNQLRSREHSLEEQAKEQARRWQQLDKRLKQTQRRSDRLVKRLALAELAPADTEIGNDEA